MLVSVCKPHPELVIMELTTYSKGTDRAIIINITAIIALKNGFYDIHCETDTKSFANMENICLGETTA